MEEEEGVEEKYQEGMVEENMRRMKVIMSKSEALVCNKDGGG